MLFLIVISCISMILKDAVGVFLVTAEARGNERLAGILNPFGTLAGIVFYSIGAMGLVHNYGFKGYLGIIPILVVDYFDGRYFTAVGRYIQSDESNKDANLDEIFKGLKVVGKQWINTFFTFFKRTNKNG